MSLLKPQDSIALVCTGTADTLESAQRTQAYLRNHYQLNAEFAEDAYSALPAERRAEILLKHLFNPEIRAIWAIRGGEGSADILPFLAPHLDQIKKSTPKLLIGFSDFTPILVYFQQVLHWPAIHAAGARQLAERMVDIASEQTLMSWLFDANPMIVLDELMPLNAAALQAKQLTLLATGGNLSLVDISIKDCWEVESKNKLLLLEDVNEKPHRLARMLKYLDRIGKLREAGAILFAGYLFAETGADEVLHRHYNQSIQKFLQLFSQTLAVPVFYTPQISHSKQNYPLPYYLPVQLQLGEKPSIWVHAK